MQVSGLSVKGDMRTEWQAGPMYLTCQVPDTEVTGDE